MRILFICNDYSLHNHIVSDYCEARPDDQVSLIKVGLVLRGKTRWQTAERILPHVARSFLLEKALEGLMVLGVTFVPKLFHRGAIFRRLSRIARLYHLPYLCTDNIMERRALDFVREQAPDLIVTLFHQIVRQDLISIPKLGIVNIHPGLLPNFRGIQPYFWELSEQYGRAGATLHFIDDEGVDTGRILAQFSYPTWEKMSVQLNYFLTCQGVSKLLPRVTEAIEKGELSPKSQDSTCGSYFRWPDEASMSRLRATGHRVVSLTDFLAILAGKYDNFTGSHDICFK